MTQEERAALVERLRDGRWKGETTCGPAAKQIEADGNRAALAACQEPQTCPKCSGSRIYYYDENHGTVCDACCPHDQGWWQLLEHYGDNNGRWCCKRGCGHTVAEIEEQRND